MRVALGQFGAELGNVCANLNRIRAMVSEAAHAGVELACFPELSLSGYLLDASAYTPEFMAGVADAVDQLAADSARHNMTLVYGAPRAAAGGLLNAVIMQLPDRSRLTYAKTHMAAIERKVFERGDHVLVDPGGIATACCYDLAFPELARATALLGARLLVVPMAWEVERGFVMRSVAPARAVENLFYVLCANQCGNVGPFTFRGGSCVVDPLGRICVALENEEDLAFCEIELDLSSRLRDQRDDRSYPLISDRRPELYEILSADAAQPPPDEGELPNDDNWTAEPYFSG